MIKNLTLRHFSEDQYVLDKVFYHNCYRIKNVPKTSSPNDNIVVDIGAHIGLFTLNCLFRGYSNFYCFEPFVENYKILLKNLEQFQLSSEDSENIHTYQLACVPNSWGCENGIFLNYPNSKKLLDFSNIETENKKTKFHISPTASLDTILRWIYPIDKNVKLLKINIGEMEEKILTESNLYKVENICGEISSDDLNIAEFQEKMKLKSFSNSFFIKNDIDEGNKYLFWFSKNDLDECFDLQSI